MPRIAWVEDEQATGAVKDCYDTLKANNPAGLPEVPELFKAMSQRPDFLAGCISLMPVHFADGHLTRAQKETIAAYVSAVNRCHF